MEMDPLHHSEINFSASDLKARRLGDWREKLEKRIGSELGGELQEAALGIVTHGVATGGSRKTREALFGLSDSDRVSVWQTVFPTVSEEVELTWTTLPPETMHQRDGGAWSGKGTHVRWLPNSVETSKHFYGWVQKLALISGPFPELDLPGLFVVGERFCQGLRWPHDSDAPAYAACAVLSQGKSEKAGSILEIIEQAVSGAHPFATLSRAIRTAALCSENPKAWELLDSQLDAGGLDDGMRAALVVDRKGVHPEAWCRFLRAVCEADLFRYQPVLETMESYLGIHSYDNSYRFENRKDKIDFFHRACAVLENEAERNSALAENSSTDSYLALYATGTESGEKMLTAAEEIFESNREDAKFGAASFLGTTDSIEITKLLRKVVHPDRLTLSSLIAKENRGLFSNSETDFQKVERLIKNFDAVESIPPAPKPWPLFKPERETFCLWLAESLPEGKESWIKPWLPMMESEPRDWVVRRLNKLNQTPEMREILAHMMRDANVDVAEHAAKAIWGQPLSPAELEVAENILELKSAKRRAFIFTLLTKQPVEALRAAIERLLQSKKSAQRLGGLELIRRLGDSDAQPEVARELFQDWDRPKKLSKEEQTQIDGIEAEFGDAEPVENEKANWCLANAFGLVDFEDLPVFDAPVPDESYLFHSPTTVALLEQMEALLRENAHRTYSKRNYDGTTEDVSLGEEGVPWLSLHRQTFEEARKDFHLFEIWENWWESRPDELRDADECELERIGKLVDSLDWQVPKECNQILYGIDQLPNFDTRKNNLERLLGWLREKHQSENRREFWVAISEQAFLIEAKKLLPERNRYLTNNWIRPGVAFPWNEEEQFDRTLATRMWKLLGRRDPERKENFGFNMALVAFEKRIATEEEIIWGFIGHRNADVNKLGRYDRVHVGEIGTLTNHAWHKKGSPEFRALIHRCIRRLIETEVRRGEAPTDATAILNSVQRVEGTENFGDVAEALGSAKLARNLHNNREARANVFTHLITVSYPAPDETVESAATRVRSTDVSERRLLEIAVLAPQWVDVIEAATKIDGLKIAVAWIHAHTKTSEWNWQAKTMEAWSGELSRMTPLSAEKLLNGGVDIDWFYQARKTVGEKIWDTLYAAAKFASSAAGHTRARLFSDALTGKANANELIKRMREKRHQDSARALGLVPLPMAKAPLEKETLRRYRALSDFKAAAVKAKPQRRASEMAAWQTGLENLARSAGFEDTHRFQWQMEAESVADLKAGAFEAQIDDLHAKLEVTPWGKIEITAERAGNSLKSIPAKLRKHPDILKLREVQEEFREQTRRLRPELEEMMINKTALPAEEWKKFLEHPLVEPMLSRLVLANARGPVGFPENGKIRGHDSKLKPWPKSHLFLAHPADFFESGKWSEWQRLCVEREIVQPFKQIFREFYTPVSTEANDSEINRFARSAIQSHQAFALFGKRGWVHHPDEGLHRVFHRHDVIAWCGFEEYFHHPRELESITVDKIHFQKKSTGKLLQAAEVPPEIFSEALRDVDLAVSVAHISGFDPESTASTVEMRVGLIEAVCQMSRRNNVRFEDRFALIDGERANYKVHLGSGVVHQVHTKMLRIHTDAGHERGKLFLPFADDDPKTAEILSKVMWLSKDGDIRDPGFLRQLAE